MSERQPFHRSLTQNFRQLYGQIFHRGSYDIPHHDNSIDNIQSVDVRRDVPTDWVNEFNTWSKVPKQLGLSKQHKKLLKKKGFTIINQVGEGGYAQVFRVRQTYTENGQKRRRYLALKINSIGSYDDSEVGEAVADMLREADLVRRLDHPNIVKRIDIINFFDPSSEFPQPVHVLIFMELMQGDLDHLITRSKSGRLSERQIHYWLCQIIRGLKYLHDQDISHLDIKPANILYKPVIETLAGGQKRKVLVFKLTDFGMARKVGKDEKLDFHYLGTHMYKSPETRQLRYCYAYPYDIYSLGITVLECVAGKHALEPVRMALQEWDQSVEEQYGLSQQFASLWLRMCDYDPNTRITIEELAEDEYITGHKPFEGRPHFWQNLLDTLPGYSPNQGEYQPQQGPFYSAYEGVTKL